MEKIKPLLLLLLLLILLCTWQKTDKIALALASDHSTVLSEKAIDFTIKQTLHKYSLSGHFTNDEQLTHLDRLFDLQEGKLLLDSISTDETLVPKGSISLTRELIPLFVKKYKNGVIEYNNETLTIEGTVNNHKIKDKVEKILSSSSIAFKNNTKVVLPVPISFLIKHAGEKNDLSGVFKDKAQEEVLQKAFKDTNASCTTSKVSENPKLVDLGGIEITIQMLPAFINSYTEGEISYQNNLLTVKGKAKSKAFLEEMQHLLDNACIPVKNLSTVDEAYLQKIAEAKKAEEEARLAEENRKLQEEQNKLAQEEAKKAEEAEKARLEEERKAEAEAEKERLAKEEEARLAKEASLKKAAQEKEARANIIKLLKVENIEFNTAKSTLTDKGQQTVNNLAAILKRYPEIHIEIAGHTDSDGDKTFNQKLSQSRVNTVKASLVSQGVAQDRLVAKGYGESKPLVPNSTDENKQKNRRVEINITGE